MVIYEFKESTYNKAFDLMDDIKEYGKKVKMCICALEDTLYDCYESSKGEEDGYEEEEYPEYEKPMYGEGSEELELSYKGSGYGARRAMRYRNNEDEEDEMKLRRGMRRSMRNMRSMHRMNRMHRSPRY